MFKLNVIIVLLTVLVQCSSSYKLLCFFPFPSRSHANLGEGFVKYLLNDGHEITYVTPIPMRSNHERLRQVDVGSLMEFAKGLNFHEVLKLEADDRQILMVMHVMNRISELAVKHERVQELVNRPGEHFDAVIVEWMFNELYSGFSAVFNCPLIWSASMDVHWLDVRIMHEAPSVSYSAYAVSGTTPPFTLKQRVLELYARVKVVFLQKWFISSKEIQLYYEAFGPAVEARGRELPPYDDLRVNGSIMFGNSHPCIADAISLPQNYKFIGGYHIIESDMEPLPNVLKQRMDESKYGVIFFSLGSIVNTQTISEEFKNNLLQVFASLKQTVIWKLDARTKNVPKNVVLVKWAPQQSILAHPNTVLFITHGGLLSINEAIHFGVPVLGTPLFGDQFMNIGKLVQKGMAKSVKLSSDLQLHLKTDIEEMVSNSSYRLRAQELSEIYHDRLVKPGEEIAHWVQHVVRTGGAPHLRSPALLVPWYQAFYLDVLALAFVVFYAILVVFRLLNGKRVLVSDVKKVN
ncbi:hypothetical protein JYU34_005292 [Plutella xylostella]|uniref:UDP-glucuronosyltransferase n=1 Tax=Plutella xylostella TaxID=51655 RepID=A0ABQ7QWB4_PLUXY|nr:hypothetical protein JYU34_005292 [Plutella xylostella]